MNNKPNFVLTTKSRSIEVILTLLMIFYFSWILFLTLNEIISWLSGVRYEQYNIKGFSLSTYVNFTWFLFVLSILAVFGLILSFSKFKSPALKIINRIFIVIGFLLFLFQAHQLYFF